MSGNGTREIPPEIWWLVCKCLTKQQDFDSLFRFALVNRSWAELALPMLYSIHDLSTVSTSDTTIIGKEKWAVMWRSIILSSVGGVTAYPYSLWIKSLKLGDLALLLAEIPSAKNRGSFFEGPMEPFQIIRGNTRTRNGRPVYKVPQIIERVGDSITKFAKEAADQQDKSVQLTSLEASDLPPSLLPTWISRLSTLSSLSLRDGSVLTADVAVSIHGNCPSFKELVCFNIIGSDVDANMAAFFNGLEENSLSTFSVISTNELGLAAFEGLTHHSSSLKKLNLSSLPSEALPSLRALSSCKALEELYLEGCYTQPPSTWATDHNKEAFLEIMGWLKSCTTLKQLGVKRLASDGTLLAEVLKSSDLRLKSLDADLVDDVEGFHSALGLQTELESLVLRSNDDVIDLTGTRHDAFLDSICCCKELRELEITQRSQDVAHLQLTVADLVKIKDSLRKLEEISFDGDLLDDDIWQPLSEMPCLTSVYTNGLSAFTFSGILTFVNDLKESGLHGGFRLFIMAQLGEAKLSVDEEATLSEEIARAFDGRYELLYWRDASEDELDLSD